MTTTAKTSVEPRYLNREISLLDFPEPVFPLTELIRNLSGEDEAPVNVRDLAFIDRLEQMAQLAMANDVLRWATFGSTSPTLETVEGVETSATKHPAAVDRSQHDPLLTQAS